VNDAIRTSVLERFLRYVKINTQSAEGAEGNPSTPCQWDLLNLLKDELVALGLSDVSLSDKGVLSAFLPSNVESTHPAAPPIAFLAHVDTYPGTPGKDVKPQILANYDGKDIVLAGTGDVLSVQTNPELASYRGETVITTDGTTLLGSDDKSGVAEIMTALAIWRSHTELPHGPIKVAFTPDEEIGQGTAGFPPVAEFGVMAAYTLDGGPEGEVENETFCADTAIMTFTGKDVHPGYAKGKMVNAIRAATFFISQLPGDALPETTEGEQGYLHPISVQGDVTRVVVPFLVRDFALEGLKTREGILEAIAQTTREKFPGLTIDMEIKHSYKNMRYYLDKEPRAVELAMKAVSNTGLTPMLHRIRGGTDGSRLSEMGLPTPNLFAGGRNFHSVQEWVPLSAMEKAVRVVLELGRLWSIEK